MTVDFQIFTWAIGLVVSTGGIAIGYVLKRISDISVISDEKDKDLDNRLDAIESSHIDTQVSLAKINKDIEYIKLQQQSISMKIDELLNKSWCKPKK